MTEKMNERVFTPVSLTERFLAYIVDIVILLSLSTIISGAAGAEPVIYKITMYYIYGHHEILRELSSQDGLVFIVTYLFLSMTYFYFESWFGISVGKYLLKMRTAIVKNVKGNKVLRSLLRATIKAIPPVAVVDSLFALKRRLKQKLSDRILGFIVVKKSDIQPGMVNYFAVGTILYYLPLLTFVLFVYLYHYGNTAPPPAPESGTIVKPSDSQIHLIFFNNFSINYHYYIVGGGFTLLFLSCVYVFAGSFITGKLLGDSLLTYPSFILYGVMPHFFLEAFGYVTGIISGIYIAKILLRVVEGYFEGRNVRYLVSMLLGNGKNAIVYAALSIILILIAAYVETYLTSYILNHYYFSSSLYGVT